MLRQYVLDNFPLTILNALRSVLNYSSDRQGNLTMISAIVAPLLLATASGAFDFLNYQNQRAALQNAADGAAIAAVKEAALQGWDQNNVEEITENYLTVNLGDMLGERKFRAATKIDNTARSVTLQIELDHYPFFYASFFPSPQIAVSATAVSAASSKVCVLGLMEPQTRAKSSIHLDSKAKIDASECSVISNSTDRFGMRVDGGSSLIAKFICSAGGVLKLWGTTITPSPVTNCPPLEDPIALRSQPSIGSCAHTNAVYSMNGMLSPGVYCGGLTIEGNAQITLSSGLYIIKDGPLLIKDAASFKGTDVSFFMTGSGSTFEMTEGTTISLSAMKTGALAGLLFSEDRNVKHSFDFDPLFYRDLGEDVRVHRITSNDARNLLGTIYLPKSILMIDAGAPVADTSAYTAIVVGRLWLREGPTLVLNADYSATDVPVPEGIGSSSSIKLIQ